MTAKKTTSRPVAKVAAKEMKSEKKKVRSVAASGVSQVAPKKETAPKIATEASKLLKKEASTQDEKTIAGSVLAQTLENEKKRIKEMTLRGIAEKRRLEAEGGKTAKSAGKKPRK